MPRQPVVSTPEAAYRGVQSPARESVPPPPNTANRVLVHVAQVLVLGAMATFIFGQIYAFSNLYNDGLRVSINEWWGVPHAVALVNGGGGPPPKVVIGHAEMVRPTFTFLFYILPIVVSALIVDWLRTRPVRRLGSKFLFSVAQLLRRKPTVFGKVSYWSYGEWIFLVGFLILGNILAFTFGYRRRLVRSQANAAKLKKSLHLDDYLELVGTTLGFNTIYNVAFLFLPATRNSAWLEFLNLSYANAIKYHRWLGVVTVATTVVHCATFYWLWVREGTWQEEALPCFDCPMDKKGQGVWFNVFGELALLCFLAIAFTSLPFVRHRFYNVFYYTHQLLFLAMVFAVMHFGPNVWWILPAFGTNGFSPVAVKELTPLSPKLVRVVLHRSAGVEGQFKVGQFLYLNVPAISKLQWHAFTVASSPRSSPTTVTMLIKGLGDWTQQLVQHAVECKDKNILPTIYVDGFYGNSLEIYEEYPTVCLIAGGIGVTPLLAVLDDLTAKLAHHETPKQHMVFIFSFRELPVLEEVAPTLARLRELDPLQQWATFHITMTSLPTDDELDAKLSNGSSTISGSATQYADGPLSHRPYARPLASSRDFKAFAFVGLFVFAVVWVVYLEFGKAGYKIRRHNAKLWPLQQFTEIAVELLSSLVVVAAVCVERVLLARHGLADVDTKVRESLASHVGAGHLESASQHRVSLQTLQVQTSRDLINEWSVRIGERSAIDKLLQQLYEQHASLGDARPIGVFTSGPEPLKRAAEIAVARIGSSAFDLHEEQFEL